MHADACAMTPASVKMRNVAGLDEPPEDIDEMITSSTDSNAVYLNIAIAKSQEAIQQLTKPNSVEDMELKAMLLTNLNGAMMSRYDRLGDPADLDAAIANIKLAIKATAPKHPELPSRLGSLSKTQLKHYGRTGDNGCLKEAYANAERAVEMAPRDSPVRASLLVALCTALSYLYDQTREFSKLEKAISLAKEALEGASKDNLEIDSSNGSFDERSRERATVLNTLANLRYTRFKRKNNVKDLEGAISCMREATALTPSSHPLSKSLLNNLGAILFAKYEHPPHDMKDLDDAISKVREAIQATPELHPDLVGRLSNLSKMLYSQYKATSRIQCLEDAISAAKRAAHLISELQRDTHVSRSGQSNTTQLSSVELAMSKLWRSFYPSKEKSSAHGARLGSLSAMQLELYERKQELTDLDEAISTGRKAVALTPLNDPNLADRLRHLEKALVKHFERTGEVKDREEADAVADERERLGM